MSTLTKEELARIEDLLADRECWLVEKSQELTSLFEKAGWVVSWHFQNSEQAFFDSAGLRKEGFMTHLFYLPRDSRVLIYKRKGEGK